MPASRTVSTRSPAWSILQIAFNLGQYEGARAAGKSLSGPEHFPYPMPRST